MTRPHAAAARGVSLLVSLVLLLVVSVIALASIRGVQLETRMSAGAYDRNLAFQSAEGALRAAETQSLILVPAQFPALGCMGGLCATPAADAAPRWLDAGFTGWIAATLPAPVAADAIVPTTITEYMGEGANWLGCESELPRQPNCRSPRYRSTSRSTAEGRATVMVQSDFAAP
jgi:type IV pilus assembly protein PilX